MTSFCRHIEFWAILAIRTKSIISYSDFLTTKTLYRTYYNTCTMQNTLYIYKKRDFSAILAAILNFTSSGQNRLYHVQISWPRKLYQSRHIIWHLYCKMALYIKKCDFSAILAAILDFPSFGRNRFCHIRISWPRKPYKRHITTHEKCKTPFR